jgi:hypothetical protein
MIQNSPFDWDVFDFEVGVHLVTTGTTYSGAHDIVIRVDDPADVFAINLLHETAHVFDSQYMTAGDRERIAGGAEAMHWRDQKVDWMNRPNEKFARAFSTAYFPVQFSQAYPAYNSALVQAVVDGRIAAVLASRAVQPPQPSEPPPTPIPTPDPEPDAILANPSVRRALHDLVAAIMVVLKDEEDE